MRTRRGPGRGRRSSPARTTWSSKLDPGTTGPNDIVITVVHGEGVTELTVAAPAAEPGDRPARQYTAKKSGPEEYVAADADLTIAGDVDVQGERPQGRVRAVRGRGAGAGRHGLDGVPDGLQVTPSVVLPLAEVELRTSRSSGRAASTRRRPRRASRRCSTWRPRRRSRTHRSAGWSRSSARSSARSPRTSAASPATASWRWSGWRRSSPKR